MHLRTLTTALLLAITTTAQDLTIQTSTPTDVVGTSPTPCLEVCVVEPCSACTTSTEGQMSIPQGETPITTPLTNPLTDPSSLAPTIQTSTSPEMGIPSGETPMPPGQTTPPPVTVTSTSAVSGPSASGSLNSTTVTLSASGTPSQSAPNAGGRLEAGVGGAAVLGVVVMGWGVAV